MVLEEVRCVFVEMGVLLGLFALENRRKAEGWGGKGDHVVGLDFRVVENAASLLCPATLIEVDARIR